MKTSDILLIIGWVIMLLGWFMLAVGNTYTALFAFIISTIIFISNHFVIKSEDHD